MARVGVEVQPAAVFQIPRRDKNPRDDFQFSLAPFIAVVDAMPGNARISARLSSLHAAEFAEPSPGVRYG